MSGCGWVILFSVFYRNLLFHLIVYYYFILFYLLFYSVVAERNCLLLNSRLDKVYIVLQAWLFRFVRAVPWFVIFSFVIHNGQLSPRLASVLGLDRCFQSDSLLYLVFSLFSYWPFAFHRVGWYIAVCVSPWVHKVQIGLGSEEMEGKRTASLFAHGHPSSC